MIGVRFTSEALHRMSTQSSFFVPSPFSDSDIETTAGFIPVARAMSDRLNILDTMLKELAIIEPASDPLNKSRSQDLQQVASEIINYRVPLTNNKTQLDELANVVSEVFGANSAVRIMSLSMLAYQLFASQQYDDGVVFAQQAAELSKSFLDLAMEVKVGVWFWYGEFLTKLHRDEEALNVYQEAGTVGNCLHY